MQLSNDQQCMQERFDLICGKTSLAHNDQRFHGPRMHLCGDGTVCAMCSVCIAYILDVWILLLFFL